MKNFLRQYFFSYFLFLLAISTSYITVTNAAPVKKVTANNPIVSIQDAWIRPTSVGQDVGAAYMTLSSAQNVSLVGIESDLTKSIEIHSMTMEKGVMKMRMLDTLQLTAGKPYNLAPGGFHLMLFDLKKPLKVGERVNFVLHFKTSQNSNKKAVEFKQSVTATVKSSAEENSPAQLH
jgi:copper(I)-binding protein